MLRTDISVSLGVSTSLATNGYPRDTPNASCEGAARTMSATGRRLGI
jgi:hypothetical protein